KIGDPRPQSTELRELAVAMAHAGDSRAGASFDQAAGVASAIPLEYTNVRAGALRDLAKALVETGYYEKAEEIAFRLQKADQTEVLCKLAAAFVKDGNNRAHGVLERMRPS